MGSLAGHQTGPPPGQREQLVSLLRQRLVSLEGSTAERASPRLGLTLAPAHTTLTVRRAAGLPDVAELLVRAVERGSPAALAGVQVGDVLVAAEGLALRSVTTLYAAMREGPRAGTMRLTGVRGGTTFESAVHAGPGVEVTLERAAVSEAATHTV